MFLAVLSNSPYIPDLKDGVLRRRMIRNKEMAEYIDWAIIFWDGKSKGSENMIEQLKTLRKPYILHTY